jgi:hypothetical protein
LPNPRDINEIKFQVWGLESRCRFHGAHRRAMQPIPLALAQQPALGDHAARHDHQMPHLMQQHHQQIGSPVPTMPGQAAFGVIQEIVRLLEADPNTDWSKVDLEALRQHLIDMNEVTLKANASAKPVDGGLEIAVTGDGRKLAAIQSMVPAHAQELNRMNWPRANSNTITRARRRGLAVRKVRGPKPSSFIGRMGWPVL